MESHFNEDNAVIKHEIDYMEKSCKIMIKHLINEHAFPLAVYIPKSCYDHSGTLVFDKETGKFFTVFHDQKVTEVKKEKDNVRVEMNYSDIEYVYDNNLDFYYVIHNGFIMFFMKLFIPTFMY